MKKEEYKEYKAPKLIELGDAVELTKGNYVSNTPECYDNSCDFYLVRN
ncbi:lasso RiPP family leader peptide-containing protein [Halobacillus amylolyticus]|uniref:Lasso RiPP family leader peptide-containing protein n=1 Tax=Halobacillus amylolyticus TaxID=2932259 RepID=A0ABY4HH18_9BACI|nr:lasso RiPP family leader peptide-containing protein [Halobacillus amylolyticus]UOR14184.1 lasso RiPP family leader peptide-containing protein [Halobacillus amylolyticus]